ncbi:cornifelin homolog B-like [Chanos chanos]|uniref:Cornifelin homolog B-like n=1 Tax=Chanos chanos TaxID=29144 RepID=A0A6J2WX22_CHACN|nr:cornifelin homolog B-like [Chanos chanos]
MATTVVVQQQPQRTTPHLTAWSSGLFDCCQDMPSCCYACWCGPCFACATTKEFGESTCLPLVDYSLFALVVPTVPPVTLSMRTAVRYTYGIGGSLFEDILVSCCCYSCSWCQMHREIKERGKNVTIITSHPVMVSPQVNTTAQQAYGVKVDPKPLGSNDSKNTKNLAFLTTNEDGDGDEDDEEDDDDDDDDDDENDDLE